MRDQYKTKTQLIGELTELRQRVADLERVRDEQRRAEEALRGSREKLDLALKSSNGGLWDLEFSPTDSPETISDQIYLSPVLKRFIGYDNDEFPNSITGWKSRILLEDLIRVNKAAQDHLEGKTDLYEAQYRIRHKDGSIRWVHTRGKILRDEHGNPLRWAGIDWDITEQKRSEEALRESESRYRRLVEGSPDIVWSFSDRRGTVYVSGRVESILGYSPDYLYRNPWLWNESIHGDDQRHVAQAITDFATGKDMDVEYRIRDSSGNWRWFHDRSIDRHVKDDEIIIEGMSRDITERKQAEETLRQVQAHAASVLDSVADTYILFDRDWRYLYVNEAAVRSIGRQREEIRGRTLWDLYPDAVGTESDRQYHRTMEERVPVAFDFHYPTTDTWWENRLYPAPEGLAVFATNITERKRTEDEFLAQHSLAVGLSATNDLNEALRLCLETAIKVSKMDCGGVYLVDKNSGGLDLKCSVALSDKFVNAVSQYDKDSANTHLVMEGKPVYRHFPVLELPLSEQKLLEELSSIAIIPICHEEQVIGCINVASRKLIDVPAFARSALETIAVQIGSAIVRIKAEKERQKLFEQLRKGRERLQALSRRLVELQETERRDLARELHDEVGQNLTALSINLNIIQNLIPGESASKATDRINDSQRLVEETVVCIRDVMARLRPPVLDDYGLVAALNWYSGQFMKRNGLPTVLILKGEELAPRLPLGTETAMFRIAQEALNNVAKHAKASQVTLVLERRDETVLLVIDDNGSGFDPVAHHQNGAKPEWGLINMRERAESVGGQFKIETAPGKGTKIIVEVPRKR